ncbi:MAG: hypothetical protein QOJ44_30, partial [Acidimicrobiaceae bacterium]|nr:hypothetical protein [Acidimicrobiaceae bacterium]
DDATAAAPHHATTTVRTSRYVTACSRPGGFASDDTTGTAGSRPGGFASDDTTSSAAVGHPPGQWG